MGPSLGGVSRPEPPGRNEPLARWQQQAIHSLEEGQQVLEALLAAMAQHGFSERAQGRVRGALKPAVRSALRYGRPPGRTTFGYQVDGQVILAEVEGRTLAVPESPFQGPHDAQLLQAAPEENVGPFHGRSYTWVRCERQSGRLSVCGFLAAP